MPRRRRYLPPPTGAAWWFYAGSTAALLGAAGLGVRAAVAARAGKARAARQALAAELYALERATPGEEALARLARVEAALAALPPVEHGFDLETLRRRLTPRAPAASLALNVPPAEGDAR